MKDLNKKGFTLVELVVVIAIVGVLAAILVPSLMGYVRKSRLKTANSNAKTAYNVVAEIDAECETQGHPINWDPSGASTDINGWDTTETIAAASLQPDCSNYQNVIKYEVTRALSVNGNESGWVYVGAASIGGTNTFFVHWTKSTADDVFGQYPQAIKNIDQCTNRSYESGFLDV